MPYQRWSQNNEAARTFANCLFTGSRRRITNGTISGSVTGLPLGAFKAAVLIHIDGLGFYSKPYLRLDSGTKSSPEPFRRTLRTGGVDETR